MERVFFLEHFSTAAVQKSLTQLKGFNGNNSSGQNLYEHLIFRRFPCPVTIRELKCVAHEQTALYSIALHSNLFSQEMIPLHGTIFYHKSVYVLWIYNYIYMSLQRNNKIKCSVNLPFALCHM